MRQWQDFRTFLILSTFVAIVAVACGGQTTPDATGDSAAPAASATPAQEVAATEPADEATTEPEPASPTASATETAALSATSTDTETEATDELSFAWTLTQVGAGIKPAIQVDSTGVVHIAFLTEEEVGGVFYTTNISGEFEIETVAEGYFYGPLDLALSSDGAPYIAYHDHQALNFDPELGDEVVAFLADGSWNNETVNHAGHDGWDNSIVVDSAGNWHTAAIDPAQFGSSSGVEYATNSGGSISVVEVGSGPIFYEFGTAIQLDQNSLPGIAYYDNNVQGLAYAKFDGSGWSIEIVDDNGDAGRYASLAFDSDGVPHISYFVFDGANSGTVRHAWLEGDAWAIEDVDTLTDVQPGQLGARKITALVFDDAGTAHIAFSDRSRLVYGQREDGVWTLQDVPHLTDLPLGQLVELAVDRSGKPHLTWFEVESTTPLFGPIVYASP